MSALRLRVDPKAIRHPGPLRQRALQEPGLGQGATLAPGTEREGGSLNIRPGDTIRYQAGGRPDAVVVEAADVLQIEYTYPWHHPGLHRTVVAQTLARDEQGEWRRIA